MRPGTRSSSRALTTNSPLLLGCSDRSTIPVNSFGPRPPSSTGLVLTWCQMCSSTPWRVLLQPGPAIATLAESGLDRGLTLRSPLFGVLVVDALLFLLLAYRLRLLSPRRRGTRPKDINDFPQTRRHKG